MIIDRSYMTLTKMLIVILSTITTTREMSKKNNKKFIFFFLFAFFTGFEPVLSVFSSVLYALGWFTKPLRYLGLIDP